jgi:hypothetical protein
MIVLSSGVVGPTVRKQMEEKREVYDRSSLASNLLQPKVTKALRADDKPSERQLTNHAQDSTASSSPYMLFSDSTAQSEIPTE